MSENIAVSLTPQVVQLNAGESVDIAVQVENCSNVVDVFLLEVEGLEPSWYRLSLVNSSLFPNDKAESILTVAPPKASSSLAETYTFALKVSSQKDPNQYTKQHVSLELLPFYVLDATVVPQKDTNPKGYFLVELTNSGNSDLNVLMSGSDPESLCRFRFDPQRPRIQPGESAAVELVVEPGKRPLKGRPRTFQLTLTATPDMGTADPKDLPAQFDATARIPSFFGNLVAFLFRRRRNPRRYLDHSAFAEPALERGGEGTPLSSGSLKWWLWIGIGTLVTIVAAAIIIWLVFLKEAGATFRGEFLLGPGEDVTFTFPLFEAVPTRVQAEADWVGAAGSLETVFLRPDGSRSRPVLITQEAPAVTFRLDQDAVELGLEDWRINLRNVTANGQADGTLSVTLLESK